jgi:hypothetical protein
VYIDGELYQPRKYNVRVPHVNNWFYWKLPQGGIFPGYRYENANQQFTLTQIHQYGLDDCERIPVTN